MRRLIGLLALFLAAVAAGGCETTTEVAPGPFTPRSSPCAPGSDVNSVGVLRRLVVPAPRSTFTHNGDRVPEMEAADAATLYDVVTTHLASWEGYDIVRTSPQDESPALGGVRDWAGQADLGTAPPEPVLSTLRALADRYRADGVLLVTSRRKPPSSWTVYLTVATATLTWPVMMLDKEGVLHADLLEAASGRVVWRANLPGLTESGGGTFGDDYLPLTEGSVLRLIAEFPAAAPAPVPPK